MRDRRQLLGRGGGFLSAVRCPVIVITGADDIVTEPIASAAQRRLHVIPACGHCVPFERPEYLNDIPRGWGVIVDQVR